MKIRSNIKQLIVVLVVTAAWNFIFSTFAVAIDKASDKRGGELASALGLKGNSKGDKKSTAPKGPIVITSKTLSLDSKQRVFTYRGDVIAKQDDLTVTADIMVGDYDEENQIKTITCEENVVVTRGDTLRSTSNRAVYDVKRATITLTNNPQLSHRGSDLVADKVIIYVNEDRSEAEGNVQVKVLKAEDQPAAGPKTAAVPTGPKVGSSVIPPNQPATSEIPSVEYEEGDEE